MTARKALQFIEIDVDYCSLSYGVAPCTAAIPTTGTIKCFNTIATCQDSANFTNVPVTLRFAEASDYRPLDIDAIPTIAGVSFSPARINPGVDLGERATLRVSFKDQPHSDTGPGFDKYHATRGYDPYRQGSFWGKFRARQPYLRGRALRWYQGYADQDLADMEVRSFIIESFDGPGVDGIYTLNAIDPLKMLDGDRAQAPVVSSGRLSADLLAATTSATLVPAGIGNSEYAASGYLALGGNELVSFTRVGDALTIVRGQLNTTAVDHKGADRVQEVLRYVSADPADIIYDLMVNYAGVPSSYIPLTEWQAETAAFLRREYTATIAEPVGVAQLVAELMRDCGLSIWWDDLAAQMRLRVLRALPDTGVSFDDGTVLAGTFSRKEQPNKRISQFWTFYGQVNALKQLDSTENYRSVAATVDTTNETNYGSPAIKKVFSRWIAQGGLTAAQRVNDLQIGQYGTPPRLFSFSVMRDASDAPRLGNAYSLSWRTEQDATGADQVVPVQVVRVQPGKDRFMVEAEEVNFSSLDTDDLSNRQITVDYDAQNLNWRTLHDELYPDPVDGDTVTMIIEAAAHVGSASTTLPALTTGNWPSQSKTGLRTSGSPTLTGIADTTGLAIGQRVFGTGIPAGAKILSLVVNTSITLDMNATSGAGTSTTLTIWTVILNLINYGRIQGRGGLGGTGANGSGDVDGTDGLPGGVALEVLAPIELTDVDGEEFGGGGGGGGGPCRDPSDHKGGGGGGGAGDLGGDGGEGPGKGREGAAGTRDAGGAGGHGWTNNNYFSGPSDDSTRRGGNGGGPGLDGQNGQGSSDVGKGDGGAAGAAIDGISKVNTVGSSGDRRGGTIN